MDLQDCVVSKKGYAGYVAKSGFIAKNRKRDKDYALDYMSVA